jgi:hypothetical protein
LPITQHRSPLLQHSPHSCPVDALSAIAATSPGGSRSAPAALQLQPSACLFLTALLLAPVPIAAPTRPIARPLPLAPTPIAMPRDCGLLLPLSASRPLASTACRSIAAVSSSADDSWLNDFAVDVSRSDGLSISALDHCRRVRETERPQPIQLHEPAPRAVSPGSSTETKR